MIFLETLEGVSYIVQILSVIAILITVLSYKATLKQLKDASERQKDDDHRQSVKESIAVMKSFAEKVIPNITTAAENRPKIQKQVEQDFLTMVNKNLPKENQITSIDENSPIRKQITIAVETRSGIGDIFNKLEQLSVYMNYGLVDQELIYGPLHKVFITFFEAHHYYFNFIRSDEAPYINVTKLYNSWKNQQLLTENRNKQAELRQKERDLLEVSKVENK